VASSGDDDVDSLQSIPVGSLDRATSRRVGALSNNRALAFSKKPARIVSSTSAPKKSFDSAFRQMVFYHLIHLKNLFFISIILQVSIK
jgi:hypothetical protein